MPPGAATGGFPTGAQTTGPVTAVAEPPKDLTVSKVVAGAGAAAASAILGSFFGALGTVTGAAAGAVFSSVVTEVMQRSLDKTRDTVKARIKLPGGRSVDVAGRTEVPAPPVSASGETGTARVYVTPGDRPTEVMSAVPSAAGTTSGATTKVAATGRPRSRRRLLVMTGFAVLVFAIGMLAITGIELVKGSPLNTSSSTTQRSGGTSLGSVLGGKAAASTESSTAKATTSATRTKAPSDGETAQSTQDENAPTTTSRARSGAGSTPTASKNLRVTEAPTANPAPAGGEVPNAQGGGEAGTVAPQ